MGYEADITHQPGSMIDGDMKRQAKVTVVRYESADGKPIKVATVIVKAWTTIGLDRAGDREARAIMERDKAKRADAKERHIQRKIAAAQAQGVCLE